MCDTYPRVLVIPKTFNEDDLIRVAEYRDAARVPVLSWIHPTNLAALCRCSQPRPGRLGRTRSSQDEALVTAIFATNPNSFHAKSFSEHYIIDARSFQSAAANQVRGAGFERAEFYGVCHLSFDTFHHTHFIFFHVIVLSIHPFYCKDCQIEFLGIGNIHMMRESFERLQRLCRNTNRHDREWLSKLDATSWLRHISGNNTHYLSSLSLSLITIITIITSLSTLSITCFFFSSRSSARSDSHCFVNTFREDSSSSLHTRLGSHYTIG